MILAKNTLKLLAFAGCCGAILLASCGAGAEEGEEWHDDANADYTSISMDEGEADYYESVEDNLGNSNSGGAEYIKSSASTDSAAAIDENDIPERKSKDNYDINRKLIKTARLTYEVEDLAGMNDKVEFAIDKAEGYVSSMNEVQDYDRYEVSYEIKVPSNNFDELVKALCTGVSTFDEKQIDVADVTEEYIDTEARIKTKKGLEQQYISLLDKANNIPEILNIETELSYVREEIESAQGRLKYLKNNVKYSTIHLLYYKNTPSEIVEESRYAAAFGNSFNDGWDGFVMFFVGLTRIWPFLIIGLSVLSYFLIKRRKRKRALAA